MFSVRLPAAVVVGLAALTAGCSSGDDRIVVFAASSLTDVFERLESEFESAEPQIDVVVTAAGSSSLVAQLLDGAPVDVLVTADRDTMARAAASLPDGADPVDFARNELVIAVEAGNPLGIDGLTDLAGGPIVVLAAPEVPAGAYAQRALRCAGAAVEPASYEQSVRAVAAKVTLGEADAGLVYRTDVDERLDLVELPADCASRADYPIVAVTDGGAVDRFMEFVTGPAGDAALLDAGFELP